MADFQFDWHLILTNLATLGFAYMLALPIAWHREHSARSLGLRATRASAAGSRAVGEWPLDSAWLPIPSRGSAGGQSFGTRSPRRR
jgi:hypothetical protein